MMVSMVEAYCIKSVILGENGGFPLSHGTVVPHRAAHTSSLSSSLILDLDQSQSTLVLRPLYVCTIL
jgi:hypothetical protein